MSITVLTTRKHLVSSAKMNIFDKLMADGRSMIYTKKAEDPKCFLAAHLITQEDI